MHDSLKLRAVVMKWLWSMSMRLLDEKTLEIFIQLMSISPGTLKALAITTVFHAYRSQM
jgi:hypothetical protein